MRKAALNSSIAALMVGCIQLPPQEVSQQAPQSQERTNPQPVPSKPVIDSGQWIDFGGGNGMSFQLKKGSFRFDQDKGGVVVAVALGRILDQSNGQVSAIQFYVKAQECVNERGSLVMTDVQGAALNQFDFLFDAGNIASSIAETICAVAYEKAAEIQQKNPQKAVPVKPRAPAI
ncbi:TPA: hypothetical protein U8203_002779 [Pseudomonas putida]|nr:hypothetical protein [Pseudomonas putida]HEN8717470.1 hypothetical protein [Pseudomonas putida]